MRSFQSIIKQDQSPYPYEVCRLGHKIQSQKQKGWQQMNRQEKLYLLLAAKSLSQNRRDKRYLLKIISLDHDRTCEVENAFEHGYEYVYKLWPCLPSQREFIRIQMLQKVGDEMVKRGEASPLVRYSQEGERFQFTGSRSQQCVLVLKFRVCTLADVEKQLSSRQLQRLNEKVELELIKNKHENENYHSYLEYTNRFLEFLDNAKYLDAPLAESHSILQTIKSSIQAPVEPTTNSNKGTKGKPFKADPNFMGEFNSRMRKSLQMLSNGKYFAQSPSQTNNTANRKGLPDVDEEENFNQSASDNNGLPRQDSQKISTQIRKRRNRYTKPPEQSRPAQNKEGRHSQALVVPSIPEHECSPNPSSSLSPREFHTLQASQAPIIRTNDFPLKEEKSQVETLHQNARRRKKAHSENKQMKDSYSSAIKRIEDVDLVKIFDRSRIEKKPQDIKNGKYLRVELYGLSLLMFRGDVELPKKVIVEVGKMKYHTLPANMKNKQAEWTKQLVIPKCSPSAILYYKVVSVSEFSFFDEGYGKLTVSDLIRSDSKTVKLYLNANNIVIGSLDFQFKISPFDENQEYPNDESALRYNQRRQKCNQRKSLSLPQISHPSKAKQRGKEGGRSGAISSHSKGKAKAKHNQPNYRYSTQPNYQQPLTSNYSYDKRSLLSRAKEKKLKMRAKIK